MCRERIKRWMWRNAQKVYKYEETFPNVYVCGHVFEWQLQKIDTWTSPFQMVNNNKICEEESFTRTVPHENLLIKIPL